MRRDFCVAPGVPAAEWELKLLPLDEIKTAAADRTDLNASTSTEKPAPLPRSDSDTGAFANDGAADLAQRAADGFLINGSTNNSASSQFALAAAFGNTRKSA